MVVAVSRKMDPKSYNIKFATEQKGEKLVVAVSRKMDPKSYNIKFAIEQKGGEVGSSCIKKNGSQVL